MLQSKSGFPALKLTFVSSIAIILFLIFVSWIEQATYPRHEFNNLVTDQEVGKLTQNQKVALLFRYTVEPVRLELNRWPYFVVNDLPFHPVAHMDNTASRQECLVTMTAIAVRNMSGLITRKDGVGSQSPLTELAYKEMNINLHNFGWWGGEAFAEPEAKIEKALALIDQYYEKMSHEKGLVVNFNPDVLQELITQMIDKNSGNGILDMGFSRLISQNPDDDWFNLDERLYCAQAGARLVHNMLSTIKQLFPEEVNFRNKEQHLDAAIDAFYEAANFNPIVVLDTTRDLFYMQYLYSVGILALERFSTKQTKAN